MILLRTPNGNVDYATIVAESNGERAQFTAIFSDHPYEPTNGEKVILAGKLQPEEILSKREEFRNLSAKLNEKNLDYSTIK